MQLQRNDFDAQLYEKIKNDFEQQQILFEKEEKKSILTILSNLIVRQINIGDDLSRKLFQLQQLGVERKILIENDFITDVKFLNIAVTGVSLGFIEWVNHFIATNQRYLNDEILVDTVILAKGYVAYYQDHFLESLSILEEINKPNFQLDLRIRIIRIRNYIRLLIRGEHEYYDDLIAHANLAIKFLKRQNVLVISTREGYIEFFKLSKQLAIIARDNNNSNSEKYLDKRKKRIQRLKEKLSSNFNIRLRGWIGEQLKILE